MKTTTAFHQVRLENVGDAFTAGLTSETIIDGIELVHVHLESKVRSTPPQFKLTWPQPAVDIQAFWHPGLDRNKRFESDWDQGFRSAATSLAPVGCLHNVDGINRMTFAVSDPLNPLEIQVGVNEETATFHCSITFFIEPSAPIQCYDATLSLLMMDGRLPTTAEVMLTAEIGSCSRQDFRHEIACG